MSELSSSFSKLFGDNDHAEGSEARSVLSPAAYLVDLLMLTENSGYHDRRPDIRQIPLDQANTYTEIPQLQIANAVMDGLVTPSDLPSRLFPPPLPFSEQFLRVKLYADRLGTTLDELNVAFAAGPDGHLAARLLLGLSQAEYDLFTTAHDSDATVSTLWGLTASELTQIEDGDVQKLQAKLGVSLKELKFLVRQNLSDSELAQSTNNPAERFFINQGANIIVLDETGEEPLLRLKDASPLTPAHLERMMRQVRLARRLELDFTDIDWLVQTTCRGSAQSPTLSLDEDGLQAIAIALELRKLADVPVDELCVLWGPLKNHGKGDSAIADDLFSRTCDNPFPTTLAAFVAQLSGSGGTVADLDERLQAMLRISGADFSYLKAALARRGTAQPTLQLAAVVSYFTGLRRIVTLATLLSVDVREMVALLDVLDAQWTVATDHELRIGAPYRDPSTALSPFELLTTPDVPPHETLDVLQKCARTKTWMDSRRLSARQLAYICLADHAPRRDELDDGSPIDDVQPDEEVEATLETLLQSVNDGLVAPGAFQTGSLTPSGAQAVFDALASARVLQAIGDPPRGLLRVLPTTDELSTAMQAGIAQRLELYASDLAALGFTDVELLFEAMVAHGYAERVDEDAGGEVESHYFVAPGLQAYFADPNNTTTFTLPNFQGLSAALFSALSQVVNAPTVEAAVVIAAGVDAQDVGLLFGVLEARGYLSLVTGSSPAEYRVADEAQAFFSDAQNLPQFVLPDFSVAFALFANKVQAYARADANRDTEAGELAGRLAAVAEQLTRVWLRTLAGFVGLSEDVTEVATAWVFGTPDESLQRTVAVAAEALLDSSQSGGKLLSNAYLASRFCRLQQLALLLRKTSMTADEARVYLSNQSLHQRLPEALKVSVGWLNAGSVDALTRLPSGDFLVVSGTQYAAFDSTDYRLLSSGSLDSIPGVALPASFETRVLTDGLDAAFSDTDASGVAVLYLFAGDQYVRVDSNGTSGVLPSSDWGKVRNNIQQNAHVDAAVSDAAGHLYVFSGDQYVRYDDPDDLLSGPTYVDERYPRSIRGKFEAEGLSPLPAAMYSGVDAAFRDGDGSYFFFRNKRFTHSTSPYELTPIRPTWGHVLNYLFEEGRLDAAFVIGSATYLTRKDQLTRYTGPAYQFVDEGFPISFGNIAESEPLLRVLRRFPDGLDAALAGSDGLLYAFRDGSFRSSADPDTPQPIFEHWGLVRNTFVDNQRVDGALHYAGITYLFCEDQYVRYSREDYEFVDEGYPKRVHANWNLVENVGALPSGLPLPVTAVAVGRTATGTTDDIYFFGGDQYSDAGGGLQNVAAHWARVRNNIRSSGVVDAAMREDSGHIYLFSGDQFFRYSSAAQTFVDETYPRRLAGNWEQESSGYSIPATFTDGISAAVQSNDGRIYFFKGQSYARVDASPVDTPHPIAPAWGLVRNWIQEQTHVNAAFLSPSGQTYVFGGNQFVRYSTSTYDVVDEGYPLVIGTRWGNLPQSFTESIDAALTFRSPVDNVQRLYLFKGEYYARYSTSNYSQVDAGYPKRLRDGIAAEGQWFRGFALHEPLPFPIPNDWIQSIDAVYSDTVNGQPHIVVFYSHGGPFQWRREYTNGFWFPPVAMSFITDYLPFTQVDAIFKGADGTLHVFSGDKYGTRPAGGGPLTTPVLIRSVWAKVFNQFADLGRVDASLSLGNGTTYLFCSTQYIKYSGTLRPGDADFYVDEGYPKRIAPNWSAEGIALTLPAQLEQSGFALCSDGSGTVHLFNDTRYDFSDNTGGDMLLTSRWGKVENHFEDLSRVDGAYRAENGKLYLFCDTQFTRYSAALEPGDPNFYADEGYPRRVSVWWSAEGVAGTMPATWQALGSAVFRDAHQTYVFSGPDFTSETSSTTPILPQWAKVRNEMQTQNRVDAGFVHVQGSDTVTFVFAADQYVRYSGDYSGYVDEGYPKVIAHLEAADALFPALGAEFLEEVRGFIAGTDGNLHVFAPPPAEPESPQLYASSADGAVHPLTERWGIIDNKLWDSESVDAAMHTPDGRLYLFSGDQFLRYSGTDRTNVDEGYPLRVATSYAAELGLPSLSSALDGGIGAALLIGTTHFYVAGSQFVSTAQPDSAMPLTDRFGLVRNELQAAQQLDAAFVAPNGKLYLFAADQYSVYSGASREYVDEEFPRVTATDIGAAWPQTGADFTQDLGAVAAFEGRSYLFKADQHVRISDFRLLQPDTGYPLANAAKFEERFDFQLEDLPEWWRAKQLFDDYSAQSPSLLELLDGVDLSEPKFSVSGFEPEVVALARATQWPLATLQALLDILVVPAAQLLDARVLARLARHFELALRVGSEPAKLQSRLWAPVFGVTPGTVAEREAALQSGADFLFQLIQAGTSPAEWTDVSRSLYNPVANAKRDALVAYLVDDDGALQDPNDVYEQLLTDVQLDASLDTSKIVEAINSIQLFYHRALMRLETVPSDVEGNLRLWWPWMKNYRIWEANRKVFLHPENYIRPELRTEKSPAFEELEEKLLQDEITSISVQQAYQTYLEAFHEIARLRVVGGYRYTEVIEAVEHRSVFMVGVTRTEPPVYYYRPGELRRPVPPETEWSLDTPIDWAPWQKVGVTIDAPRVRPVYAFNRLFLFWIETTPYNSTEFTSGSGTSYDADSEGTRQVKLKIKFTFYNFTKEWVAPQTVVLAPTNPVDPEALPYVFAADVAKNVVLTANNPVPQGGGNEDYINLSFQLFFWEWKLGRLRDSLDLELDSTQGWRFQGLRFLGDQETSFPTQLGIDAADVTAIVPWGEHGDGASGDWFSFDAKGGTFLCRPSEDPPTFNENEILGQTFNHVTAVFNTASEDVFVFALHTAGDPSSLYYQRYTSGAGWGSAIDVTSAAWPWGRLAGVFELEPTWRIENVIVAAQGGKTFFLLGSQHFSYSGNAYDVTEQPLIGNLPNGAPTLDMLIGSGLPSLSWTDVTASGRSLVSAFKLPGADRTIVVSQAGGSSGVANLDLDDLRQASQAGSASPFDGWTELDAVFLTSSPESRIVFTRGTQIVIFTWSSRSWSTGNLAALPGGASGLSAAFEGRDGVLYFFVGDLYAVVDPTALDATLTFQAVAPRWGQLPSLFNGTLTDGVDGAQFGPDGKLYLFSGEYCLPHATFNPNDLDALVVSDVQGQPLRTLPPKLDDVWRDPFGGSIAFDKASAAFSYAGKLHVLASSFVHSHVMVRYSGTQSAPPFRADAGYPIRSFSSTLELPAGFYARLFANYQLSFSITRLTSNTSEGFSRALFAHGLGGLLSLGTQVNPELPTFTAFTTTPPSLPAGRNELYVDTTYVSDYPGKGQNASGLDFTSANAFYYWEIFFHVPFLIAQTLKQSQRFEDALHWYEYVFDPSVPQSNGQYWRFLAFVENATFNKEEDLSELGPQLTAYRDDPFDPHAIGELRPLAYKKAFVMSYIDNLIVWGDMLFRQYTRETIGEATMLYVRAGDILGRRPQQLGKRALSATVSYDNLTTPSPITITEEILKLENGVPPVSRYDDTWAVPNDSIFNPYFYIPENEDFVRYWDRVEDRLTKIRHGLDIDGVKRSLALFSPPVDVLALVKAFASGAGLAQALADYNMPVPHYRFSFMLGRARELTARVTSLGAALLAALEKKDAEELALLRNTQERQILEMQLEIRQQQVNAAAESLAALQEGLKNAQTRQSHYQQLLATGLSAYEQTQIATAIIGQVFSQVANVLSVASSGASFAPQAGSPFALTYGGDQIGKGLLGLSHAFRAQAEMASFQSSLAATLGGWERRAQDWQLQANLASGDVLQIGRQIKAAEIQVQIANRELQVHRRQIRNNEAIDTFMNSKFTSKQLYQWMIGKLSGVYFQTYNLALGYAKAAQRAFQFELAVPESEVQYIGAGYWDSLKKGLLAGEQLQLDIDRLEKAYIDANTRMLEITRHVSLLQVDPLALLRLKEQGRCEFELGEALFDSDFPGHYCRQIKTVALSFPAVVGPYQSINATLTQLGHRTLLTPDKAGLGYLLGQGGEPQPNVVRVDWRPNQQVALSTGVNDSGLFQVNYSDERYLPFEGTGAVSSWRLEIDGVNGAMHRRTLTDVVMTVQYTARQGGSAFAEVAKRLLGKAPNERTWLLNLAADYSDAWQAFLANPTAGMTFSVERNSLPQASSRANVTGVYLHYEPTAEPQEDLSRQALLLTTASSSVQLKPGTFKSGLELPLVAPGQDPTNAAWVIAAPSASAAAKFTSQNVRTIALVVTYSGDLKL